MVLGLTSDTLPLTTVDAYAENILVPKISQIAGVGLVGIGGQQKPAIRVQVDPQALANRGIGLEDVRNVLAPGQCRPAEGHAQQPAADLHAQYQRPAAEARGLRRADRRLPQRLAGAHPRHRQGDRRAGEQPDRRLVQQPARHHSRRPAPARRQRDRDGRPHQDAAAAAPGFAPARHQDQCRFRPHADHPRVGRRRAIHPDADGRPGRDGDLYVPAQFLGDRHSGDHRAACR